MNTEQINKVREALRYYAEGHHIQYDKIGIVTEPYIEQGTTAARVLAALDAAAPVKDSLTTVDVAPSLEDIVKDAWSYDFSRKESKWPDGYCTDPNGKVIPPAGCDVDFNFGYDLGYVDGLQSIQDSVAAIEKRTLARYASAPVKESLTTVDAAVRKESLPTAQPDHIGDVNEMINQVAQQEPIACPVCNDRGVVSTNELDIVPCIACQDIDDEEAVAKKAVRIAADLRELVDLTTHQYDVVNQAADALSAVAGIGDDRDGFPVYRAPPTQPVISDEEAEQIWEANVEASLLSARENVQVPKTISQGYLELEEVARRAKKWNDDRENNSSASHWMSALWNALDTIDAAQEKR